MELEGDDIVLVRDNRPKDPVEDPLEINKFNALIDDKEALINLDENKMQSQNESDSIINLDSSDDEICKSNEKNQENAVRLTDCDSTTNQNSITKTRDTSVLRKSLLQEINKSPSHNIIDLDEEDSDPLAPLRTFMNPPKMKNISRVTPIIKKDANINKGKGVVHRVGNGTVHTKIGNKTLENLKNIKCTPYNGKRKAKTNKKPIVTSETTQNPIITLSKPVVKLVNKTFQKNQQLAAMISCNTDELKVFNKSKNFIGADVSKNKSVRYLGKIIHISGQPSLIQNPSDFVYGVEGSLNGLKNYRRENTLESKVHLYKNSFINLSDTNNGDSEPNELNPISNLILQDVFVPKSVGNDEATSVKVTESDSLDSRSVLDKINGYSTTNIKSRKELIKNNFKKCSKISATKPKLVMSESKNINKQYTSALIPYQPKESNSTVLDLNLNINDARSSQSGTIPVNNSSQTQNTLNLSNEPLGGYNFALGLVLNVNDTNNSNSSYQIGPQNQLKTVNNVALDVTLKALPQIANRHQLVQVSSNDTEDCQKEKAPSLPNETKGNIYCCNLCSFKSSDFVLMQAHKCSCYTFENNVSTIKESLHEEIMFCCIACSFKTINFCTMKSHECSSANNASQNLEQVVTVPEKIYNCVDCLFKTPDLEVMKCHDCSTETESRKQPLENKKSTREIVADKKLNLNKMFAVENYENGCTLPKIYSCISCPFKTASLELVESHRCRDNISESSAPSRLQNNVIFPETFNIPRTSDASIKQYSGNNLNELLEGTIQNINFICEMCNMIFKNKNLLFQHLKTIHFGFRRIMECYLCSLYFLNFRDLLDHFKQLHGTTNDKIINKEAYRCIVCSYQTEDHSKVKIHFNKHQQEDSSEPQKTGENVYECKLCGHKTESITLWLTHVCRRQREYNIDHQKQKVCNTYQKKEDVCQKPKDSLVVDEKSVKCTYKRSYIQSSQNSCYYCKSVIYTESLKCGTSGCENMCHLKCIDRCSQFMYIQKVYEISNWFCLECNGNKNEILPTAQNDIDNIKWCLDFANKEYFIEAKKLKSAAHEIQKIKDEKLEMKSEFDQIKKFIVNSKSEKINNDVVKTVCSIIELFINAGCNSED